MLIERPNIGEAVEKAKILIHELRKLKLDMLFEERNDFGCSTGLEFDSGHYTVERFDHLIKTGLAELKIFPDDTKYKFLCDDGSRYDDTYVYVDNRLISSAEVKRLAKIEFNAKLDVAWATRPHDLME